MIVVVYNTPFVMISIVITIITVPITIIVVVILVTLVFIIVVVALIITRTINFMKTSLSINNIIYYSIFFLYQI